MRKVERRTHKRVKMGGDKVLLTQTDMLIVAALSLEQIFRIEELTVAAWKLWPEVFCIKGFVEYPDNNKTLVALMSKSHGGIRKGLVFRVETGKYMLTQVGRAYGQLYLEHMKADRTVYYRPQPIKVSIG